MAEFDGTLPKEFVLAKPIEHTVYDPKVLAELEQSKQLIITRKRNGWKMYLVADAEGKIRFFTDGINEVSQEKVAHLTEEARKMRVPACSVIVGEAVSDGEVDDRGKVISVMHAKDPTKVASLETKLYYRPFGIVFWKGSLNTSGFLSTLIRLERMCRRQSYIYPVEYLQCSLESAQKISRDHNWEGLVLYHKNYQISYRTDGKSPKRPSGCYKWKAEFDGDFIVRNVIYRPGTKIVKELILLQIDPVTKKEFNCGKYGVFTHTMRKWLSEEATYPLVVELRFDSRYEKTGKLENPRGFEIRHDKKIEHCVSPRSFPESGMR